MNQSRRKRNQPPLFIELAPPAVPPLLPEPSSGQISCEEMIEWYAMVLQWNVKQMEHGDAAAWAWANSLDRSDPLSFVNICRFFRVDPSRMQDAIAELVDARRRGESVSKEERQ